MDVKTTNFYEEYKMTEQRNHCVPTITVLWSQIEINQKINSNWWNSHDTIKKVFVFNSLFQTILIHCKVGNFFCFSSQDLVLLVNKATCMRVNFFSSYLRNSVNNTNRDNNSLFFAQLHSFNVLDLNSGHTLQFAHSRVKHIQGYAGATWNSNHVLTQSIHGKVICPVVSRLG